MVAKYLLEIEEILERERVVAGPRNPYGARQRALSLLSIIGILGLGQLWATGIFLGLVAKLFMD